MAEQVANLTVPTEGEFRFTSELDGLSLQGYRFGAKRAQGVGATDGIVVIAHGAAEHAARYARFAAALGEKGLETWALDHRGHGRSPGPEGLGDTGAPGWDGMVSDLAQLVRLARATTPDTPVCLFGHSMGAFLAQHYATRYSDTIDALVLSGSTAFDFPDDLEALPEIDFNQAFEPARTPYDWLSRDEAEVDKYVADPLCGFEAVKPVFTIDNLRALSSAEALAHIRDDLPVLLVAGDQDPLNVNLLALARLKEKLTEGGIAQIDSLFYEGGRHEMLNELNRDEVTRDVLGWLQRVLRSDAVRHSYIRLKGGAGADPAVER